MIVRTFFKESDGANIKAEIHDTPEGYAIYFYTAGEFLKSETYQDKSIQYVESAAENWMAGIKVLRG